MPSLLAGPISCTPIGKPVGGEARRHVDRRPAQHDSTARSPGRPRSSRGRCPGRPAGRRSAANGGGCAVVGASTTSTMWKIEPTRRWSAASCAARAAQYRLSQAAGPSADWTRCGGPRSTSSPSRSAQSSRPAVDRGEKVPRQPQPVVRVARDHAVAEQLELLADPFASRPGSPDAAWPEIRCTGTGLTARCSADPVRCRRGRTPVTGGGLCRSPSTLPDAASSTSAASATVRASTPLTVMPLNASRQRPGGDAAALRLDADQVGPRRGNADAARAVGADRGGDQIRRPPRPRYRPRIRPACACVTRGCGCGRSRVRW